MFIAKRIKELLDSNECRGAFNACPELQDYNYDPQDFTSLKGWQVNQAELEVVSSNDAMFLFEDGILKGISIYLKRVTGVNEISDFETVRGKDSDHIGPLLDGFL